MSDFKMKIRVLTNQSSQVTQNSGNQVIQQSIARSLQNQNSYVKLGFSGIKRNYAALQVQGQKFCKSCNDKK